jgi:hypothetical protein
MLLQAFDLFRFIQVYIAQLGVGGIYFLIIAVLILKRSTKQLNQIFASFFISVAIGTIINVIYATLTNATIVRFLHILTYYFFCIALVFLLLFNLMILKSEQMINRKKQLFLIIIWAGLLLGLFIIGLTGNVHIDATTDWKPAWDLPYFLYGFILCLSCMIIPTIYTSIQIYNEFEDELLKEKWRYFLIGTGCYYLMWGGTSISNFLANDLVRSIWGVIALLSFVAIYAMYYGVGKQIED